MEGIKFNLQVKHNLIMFSVPYPEVNNHYMIEEILHMGYMTNEEHNLQKNLDLKWSIRMLNNGILEDV
ncbi:hypothetical protein [Bacillus sp. WMMC1349]|uniref:hypothetical protein n=1 Tax=Bacillus sp. WMMC1349 TaxID=2736254 RepID=UPI0020A67D15|nr:hypothetical protein [Bacillus sp. WMMC1349]